MTVKIMQRRVFSGYVNNSKINFRLVGKKKRVVIAPKRMLNSYK